MTAEFVNRELKLCNNGAGIDIFIIDITNKNKDRGGEIVVEMKLHWKDAQLLAKRLLDAAHEAMIYESKIQQGASE